MNAIRHLVLKIDTILRVIVQGIRYYFRLVLFAGKPASINLFERRIYSQNGEDGIIQYIFHLIGMTNRFFVEIGAGDGVQCNTRFLKRIGWIGVQIDALENNGVKKHFVSVDNIESIMTKYRVPSEFDLLSIDIDGNDYWIWDAIKSFNPRVVMIEYNGMLGDNKSLVMPYDKKHLWDGTDFFGASLLALTKLARKKGYRLVGTDSRGVNAFFVKQSLVNTYFLPESVKNMYHSPQYVLYPRSHKQFVDG